MTSIDLVLAWLWRVLVMAGLLVGIQVPPMLLRLINELIGQPALIGWQIAATCLYFLVFAIVAMVAGVTMRHYAVSDQWTRLTPHDWRLVWGSYFCIILCEGAFELVNRLVYRQTETENNSIIKNLMSGSTVALWLMGFSAVILTPIVEELIFRGALMNLFFNHGSLKIILSGLVFGSLHSSSTLASWLIYVMMGLILATVYWRSHKIQTSILLHFVINAAAMGVMIYQLT